MKRETRERRWNEDNKRQPNEGDWADIKNPSKKQKLQNRQGN